MVDTVISDQVYLIDSQTVLHMSSNNVIGCTMSTGNDSFVNVSLSIISLRIPFIRNKSKEQ